MLEVAFNELESVVENPKMMGSESILCDCYLDGKHYIYKQPNSYNIDTFNKMKALAKIQNEHLLLPKIFVFQTKPIGYLLPYLDGYESFYNLKKNKTEKIKLLKKAKDVIIEMHKYGIIHGDLHTANIMYKDDDIKIIDFESSKYLNYEFGETNDYSIEYLKRHKPNKNVDIYNFNIDTISILYKYNWHYVFNKEKLETDEQLKVWQKTKEKKRLTYNDFLIDRY